MKKILSYLLYLAFFLIFSCQPEKEKMNIIVFFIDDLGWTDLGCYGSDLYETPNIDKLAKEGKRFSQAYAACTVCSPSRAALMTGKYPARLHLTDWIKGHKRQHALLKVPDWQMYLDTTETTMANVLKDKGYATAIFGKWHLGDDPSYWPDHQGFDLNVGGYKWGQPGSYFFPYIREKSGMVAPPGLKEGKPGEYLTYRLTDEAIHFIKGHKEQPFFIYFPHYAVHTPLQAPDSLTEYYESKIKPDMRHRKAVYAAMIHAVDQSVGKVMSTLKEEGLEGKTAVFFTSDNGGLVLWSITDNYPLRAGKGSVYEGGVRVPFIAKVPGMTEANSICHEPIITMDLFPTVLSIAGAHIPINDGKDLSNILAGNDADLNRNSIFWHYPHYHPGGATPYSAIRKGNFRLIEFFEDSHLELYDLGNDIGETNDLSEQQPEKVGELYNDLKTWQKEVNAQLPTKNPESQESGVATIGSSIE